MAQRVNDGGHPGMGHPRERRRTRIYDMPQPNSSVISNSSSQSSRSSSRSSHSSGSSSDWSDSGYGSASSSSSAPHRRSIHHHWHVHPRDGQGLGLPELIPYTPSAGAETPVIPDSSTSSPIIPHAGSETPDPFLPQGAHRCIYHGHTLPASRCPTPVLNAPRPDDIIDSFHPHLQQYYHPNSTNTSGFIHVPSLQWDIIYPPSRARYLPGRSIIQHPHYMGAACAPPTVRRIHLTSTHECLSFWMSPDRWGPIILDDPHPPTVHRVLEKIYDYLRQPLDQQDIAAVLSTPINRTRINEARRSRLHDTAGMHLYGGYVRSDVLGGHRRFFGCRMSIQDGIWRASVDFIPGPVLRLW